MCATCDEQSGCKNILSITEDRKNATEVRSLSCPEGFSQLSDVSNMMKNPPFRVVYRRRNHQGAAAAISERAETQTYQGVDPHNPENSMEICKASQVHHEAGDSGQFFVHKGHDLVYCRRKFQGASATISEQAETQTYQGVDLHNHPKSMELCRDSQVHYEASNSGQCFVHKVYDLVYRRRKNQGISAAISQQAQRQTCKVMDPHKPAESKEICKALQVYQKAGNSRKRFMHKFHDSREASKNISLFKEMGSVNDSCSSSKLNSEQISGFTRTEVDGTGECSSSCAIVMEDRGIEISAKELCVSVLKRAGLLGVRPKRSSNPFEGGVKSCSQQCKVCGKSEATLKMLLCDNCEAAFHVSCCNARVKKISNEWFCSSCLKLKRNVLKEMRAIKTLHISREQGRCNSSSHKDELYHMALFLEDAEPYRSSVRVGKGFQADIPDWLGLANYKVDAIIKPLEIYTSECLSLQKLNSTKNSRFSSIGNWLQCRQIIDGVGRASGTVCGKWRRAPLSEVQTDNWECFCSVLWDPAHSDCNSPQELETDQVLKQLKYVEMLRPRLAAKRRKMDSLTTDNARDVKKNLTNT